MAKYRKKPIVIEAIQWTEDNLADIAEFVGLGFRYDEDTGEMKIITLEGEHVATYFDFIIRGIKGEFYPCKPDIFIQTYERVE